MEYAKVDLDSVAEHGHLSFFCLSSRVTGPGVGVSVGFSVRFGSVV